MKLNILGILVTFFMSGTSAWTYWDEVESCEGAGFVVSVKHPPSGSAAPSVWTVTATSGESVTASIRGSMLRPIGRDKDGNKVLGIQIQADNPEDFDLLVATFPYYLPEQTASLLVKFPGGPGLGYEVLCKMKRTTYP